MSQSHPMTSCTRTMTSPTHPSEQTQCIILKMKIDLGRLKVWFRCKMSHAYPCV